MDVLAPWPGIVNEVQVVTGDAVAAEQELVVLESMKMLTPILAPAGGTVTEVAVAAGDVVEGRQLLLRLAV